MDSPRGARAALGRALKRCFDLGIATALLVLLAPVIAAIAVWIKLDSRGPVFYRCRRVGLNGSGLHVLKFRKMQHCAAGHPLTTRDDDRFTTVGRFLAKSKLDELPQLWNVVTGNMSLVGPRPEDEVFVSCFPKEYEEIHRVKPGITGVCQLAFSKESEIIDPDDRVGDYVNRLLPQKVALDRLYAARRSTGMDLRILAWTAIAVLLRRDVAVNRTSGRLSARRRERVRSVLVSTDSGGQA